MPNASVPPARYDSPWKAALTHAFRDFVTFFFPELSAQIDWTKQPRFRDKELAGISLGGTPDGMVADKRSSPGMIRVCQHGWRKQRIIVLFKIIDWMMALPEPHQKRYWRAVLQLEKEQKMEWISPLEQSFIDKGWQKGLKAGLKEGREEGREEGRREGAVALLERLLTQRFAPLPKTLRSRLAKASLVQLEAWSDALHEAESLKQVFE
jgi:hypothetical protein